MAFEPSVAVFDACILYPFHLRNIVVQAAVDRLVEARWTDTIHEEWIRNLATNAPAIPIERLQLTRRLMGDALPTAMVTGYEGHILEVTLPDPDDRHVVAAAITAKASLILTWNMRHFPESELKKFGLQRVTPDEFLSGIFEKAPDLVIGSLANARRNLTKSQVRASDFTQFSTVKISFNLRSKSRSTFPICRPPRHRLDLTSRLSEERETTAPHQKRRERNATNAIEIKRKSSKINEFDRYPAAHNGLVAGWSPAGPTSDYRGLYYCIPEG
jgi:predicted nucleic acid-binding protein